jgi:hypothetical protein
MRNRAKPVITVEQLERFTDALGTGTRVYFLIGGKQIPVTCMVHTDEGDLLLGDITMDERKFGRQRRAKLKAAS